MFSPRRRGRPLFVALDDTGNLVMGTGWYAVSGTGSSAVKNIWSFWIVPSETSDIADTEFWSVFAAGVALSADDVRSTSTVGHGQSSIDITAYTETMDMDMTVTYKTGNYLGEESTEEKLISDRFVAGSDPIVRMSEVPVAAEALLAGSGVTLGDLGFTLMDKAAPAPAAADAMEATETAPAADPAADAAGSGAATVPEDAIDLKTVDGQGEIKYAGWEYLPEGVVDAPDVDMSKVILVKMDYTNYREDEATQQQDDFWFRVYQNGVELDSAFGVFHPEKCKPLDDYFKTVMMGGTVTVGQYYLLEDGSPITIIVNEQGGNDSNKQSMTVELN